MAISFGGRAPERLWEEVAAGEPEDPLVLTCERHLARSRGDRPILALPCIGMAHPDLIGAALDAGRPVRVVGCPPGDCANREGVTTLAARLARERRPRLKKRYAGADLTVDWVPPDRIEAALAHPGQATDGSLVPALDGPTLRSAIQLAVLVAATAVFSVWVTGFRFDPDGDGAAITLSLDHRAGVPLVGHAEFEAAPTGAAPRITVVLDGVARFDEVVETVNADQPDTALLYERFDIEPGTHRLEVTLFDDPVGTGQVLFADTVAVAAGEAIVLDYRDESVVDPVEAGRSLFSATVLGTNAGCRICHSLDAGRDLVGPSLAGIGGRAGTVVPGLPAEEYLRQSLLEPDAYVVPGYPAGQMLQVPLTDREVDELVAFMLSLEASS